MPNPESMNYTPLSAHQKVVEANAIVITEAQKVLYESQRSFRKKLAKNAEQFLWEGRKK